MGNNVERQIEKFPSFDHNLNFCQGVKWEWNLWLSEMQEYQNPSFSITTDLVKEGLPLQSIKILVPTEECKIYNLLPMHCSSSTDGLQLLAIFFLSLCVQG